MLASLNNVAWIFCVSDVPLRSHVFMSVLSCYAGGVLRPVARPEAPLQQVLPTGKGVETVLTWEEGESVKTWMKTVPENQEMHRCWELKRNALRTQLSRPR